MKLEFAASILAWICVAQAWLPTDSYAPGEIDCPSSNNLVRHANGISSDEADWVKSRQQYTNEKLIEFLQRANMTDFDASDFVTNKAQSPINIGVAFSGGGYRAMLAGAGQLAALDERTNGANKTGLGGLLQALTYLAGLLGGNWLVGTIVMNNWTDVDTILREGKLWDLSTSIVNYGGINVAKTLKYYKGISDDLEAKRKAGFEVSLTDTWGRALLHQFFTELNDTGAALTWLTLQDLDPFTLHQMPFPIVVADGRTPGLVIISGNSTVFEFNAFEMGSWDPSLYQFSQVKYLGTSNQGGVANTSKCIGGFDNAGFVMGTSLTLFNQFILQINTTSLTSAVKSIILSILGSVAKDENDIAVYKPNPFYDTSVGTVSSIAKNDTLYLVDGGEDLQNIPLHPLIQPQRGLDVIFAYDNSADTNQNWPSGASLVASYERQFLQQSNGTIFPHVPDTNSFRNLNLTARPTFFGCDARNLLSLLPLTNSSDLTSSVYDLPLIVYTANRPFSYWGNTSTFDLKYDERKKRGVIRNGYETALRLNGTLDLEFQACVGCAIIRRQQERQNISQSDQCKQCFERYCWDGSIDNREPNINFTNTGTTNGTENTTTSGAIALIEGGSNYSLVRNTVYAMLVVLMISCSF